MWPNTATNATVCDGEKSHTAIFDTKFLSTYFFFLVFTGIYLSEQVRENTLRCSYCKTYLNLGSVDQKNHKNFIVLHTCIC